MTIYWMLIRLAHGKEIVKLWLAQKLPIPEAQTLSLTDYKFNDFSLNDDVTLCATARMFVDLNLINRFGIPYEVRASAAFTG